MKNLCAQLNRKSLVILISACSVIMLSSCSPNTPINLSERFRYREKILNVFFFSGNSKLAVLGERYHYLFDGKQKLDTLEKSSFAKKISGSFTSFVVLPNDRVTGRYRFLLSEVSGSAQREEAIQLGFKESPDGQLEITEEISGERYASTPIAIDSKMPSQARGYTVDVSVVGPTNTSPKTSHPITQAADRIATLFAMPVAVLTLFFLY